MKLTAANAEPETVNHLPSAIFSITAANEVTSDGSLFIPFGDTPVIASNGERVIQRHDRAAMESMTGAFNSLRARFMRKLKGDVPIFLGHPDMPGCEEAFPDRRARGWVESMNVESAGLRLSNDWNNLGQELRTEGKNRFPSPRWALDFTGENVDGVRVTRPVALLSVGMIDRPNIKSVIAYNSVPKDFGTETETPNQEVPTMDKRLQFLLAWLGLTEASNEEQVKSATETKVTAINTAESTKQKAVTDLVNERAAWATSKTAFEGRITELDGKLTAANALVADERKGRIEAAYIVAINEGRLTAADKDARLAVITPKLSDLTAVNAEIETVGKLEKKVKTTTTAGNVGDRKGEAEISQQRITAINSAVGEKMQATGLPYHEAYLAVKREKKQLFESQQ